MAPSSTLVSSTFTASRRSLRERVTNSRDREHPGVVVTVPKHRPSSRHQHRLGCAEQIPALLSIAQGWQSRPGHRANKVDLVRALAECHDDTSTLLCS